MNDERLVAHLQMIQGVINRLAGNSFSMKGLALTAVAGLAAIAYSTKNPPILYMGAAAAIIFGALDSYYLYLERKYIAFFNKVRKGELDQSEGPFSLNYSICCGRLDYFTGSFSWPAFLLYTALAVASMVLIGFCPK